MQAEMHLLLLRAVRPCRRSVVGRELHPHDPLPIDDDAVPGVVPVDLASLQPGPEAALRLDVRGVDDVEHDVDARG